MKKLMLFLYLVAVGMQTAFSQKIPDSIRLNKTTNVATTQYGVASYYHDKFEGRLTATGDLFAQEKLTAACNTLPLKCWVRVTNVRNKKSVIVYINDRMHHLNTRAIDLSKAAATRLGFIARGLTRVKVEYLGRKKPKEAEEESPE